MVRIAYKTLHAIEAAILADGGASFRYWEGQVFPHMDDAYRPKEEGPRGHLGASVLGHECAREIWYGWRWFSASSFDGRMLRLFNRGHLEEARFIAMLLMIGCQVYQQDANGKQYRIHFGWGHGGGSGDGVAIGIPDLEANTPVNCEFKTHGEKSFIELAGKLPEWRKHVENPQRNPFTGKGVREAKPEHFIQMQLYMHKMGLAAALYVAVNKNTDDIYAELIALDSQLAEQYINRGEKIIEMREPPKKLSESPGFFKCRFCNHIGVCHLRKAPQVNCRTCKYSIATTEGDAEKGAVWRCALRDMLIDKDTMANGCNQHVSY